MDCKKCKNPNKENLTECEWCGVSLEPKLNNASRNNSINVAEGKALKYTIYFVLFVLISLLFFTDKDLAFSGYFIFIFGITTIELYSYLKNRFSK